MMNIAGVQSGKQPTYENSNHQKSPRIEGVFSLFKRAQDEKSVVILNEVKNLKGRFIPSLKSSFT